MKPPITNKP